MRFLLIVFIVYIVRARFPYEPKNAAKGPAYETYAGPNLT